MEGGLLHRHRQAFPEQPAGRGQKSLYKAPVASTARWKAAQAGPVASVNAVALESKAMGEEERAGRSRRRCSARLSSRRCSGGATPIEAHIRQAKSSARTQCLRRGCSGCNAEPWMFSPELAGHLLDEFGHRDELFLDEGFDPAGPAPLSPCRLRRRQSFPSSCRAYGEVRRGPLSITSRAQRSPPGILIGADVSMLGQAGDAARQRLRRQNPGRHHAGDENRVFASSASKKHAHPGHRCGCSWPIEPSRACDPPSSRAWRSPSDRNHSVALVIVRALASWSPSCSSSFLPPGLVAQISLKSFAEISAPWGEKEKKKGEESCDGMGEGRAAQADGPGAFSPPASSPGPLIGGVARGGPH